MEKSDRETESAAAKGDTSDGRRGRRAGTIFCDRNKVGPLFR